MRSRRRTLGLVAASLATLLAVSPLLPDAPSDRTDGPSATPAAGGAGLTPDLQREIDRVVAEGLARARVRTSARATPARLVADQVRCAELAGQRYCLGQGWTTRSEDAVQSRVAVAVRTAAARRAPAEHTGDLGPLAAMRRTAAMTPRRRAALERAELTEAARSVGKVWQIRHEVQGVPLPTGYAERYPGATSTRTLRASTTGSGTSETKTWSDYPERRKILKPRETTEQVRTYWCGPATMQMIGWGWRRRLTQQRWANRLGTTTSGSAITEMVRTVNEFTGYDRPEYAGRYITLDIGSWRYSRWWLLVMRHVEDYRAPLVMHPVLRKEYYSYLDDDASGHFQVGRGFDKRGDQPNVVGFFEPWNQQRFDPSEPFIKRVQWYSAYKQFRANKAHFQHNIGV